MVGQTAPQPETPAASWGSRNQRDGIDDRQLHPWGQVFSCCIGSRGFDGWNLVEMPADPWCVIETTWANGIVGCIVWRAPTEPREQIASLVWIDLEDALEDGEGVRVSGRINGSQAWEVAA
jgi:hypothetical protein